MYEPRSLLVLPAILLAAACSRDPSHAAAPTPTVSVGPPPSTVTPAPTTSARKGPTLGVRDVGPIDRRPPEIKCQGVGPCKGTTPVCCIQMDFSAGPTYACTPSWEVCMERKDTSHVACRSRRDCPAGESCCHAYAQGERCEAKACGQGGDIVCQHLHDCPAHDERAAIGCKLEVGAYVVDEYGYCAYE